MLHCFHFLFKYQSNVQIPHLKKNQVGLKFANTAHFGFILQNLTDAKHILFWGKVALAEEAPADRAIRTQTIDQGKPILTIFSAKR